MKKTKSKKKQSGTYVNGIKLPQTHLELRQIEPQTQNQQRAFVAFDEGKNLLLHGLAGTGKTLLSMYMGLCQVMQKNTTFSSVVIARSVVPTRDIGFLPGDETEKIKIYETPYKNMCSELFGRDDAYEILKRHNIIDFITTSFIRGITINNAVVVVDEMQNLTGHELDSIVTRLGDNCKVILCGDSTQSDFVKSTDKNGLPKFLSIIGKLNTFAFIEFFEQDIVRSGFVKDYIIEKNKQSIQF
ncbi:MAG: hypothetical protein EBS98_09565 [Chitinophagia bacterium]|jgi:predicted ribonuclease YlaK|nr:hypothetical protein [Chitinophagia bacterium]